MMTRGDLAKLKEVRDQLTDEHMSRCSFYDVQTDDEAAVIRSMLGSVKTTALVVRSTALWRETWILPALNGLIAKYEAQLNKPKRPCKRG